MSLGLALIALVIVAIAENARIPVDNPATHLELTMVHEAMVLEYSGRHLALIELASELKLLLYISPIACVFVPWGLAGGQRRPQCRRSGFLCRQAHGRRNPHGPVRNVHRQDARVPRARFLGTALMLGLLASLLLFVSRSLLSHARVGLSTSHTCWPVRWCW